MHWKELFFLFIDIFLLKNFIVHAINNPENGTFLNSNSTRY